MVTNEFAAVFDDQLGNVYGFFAYRLRSRSDAEDLTQLTFERALQAWDRYDPAQAGVATWLLAIARNLLIDHTRADRTSRQRPLDELHGDHRALAAVPQHADLGIEPELERALGLLTDRQREIVALRFGADLSGQQIAQLTGLRLGSVQQILSRALRRMRGILESDAIASRDIARSEKAAGAARVRA